MGWLKDLMGESKVENPFVPEDPIAKKNREIIKAQQEEAKKAAEVERMKELVGKYDVQVKSYKDHYVLKEGKIMIYIGMGYDPELNHVQIRFMEGEDAIKNLYTYYTYKSSGPLTLDQFMNVWITKIKDSRLAFIELHQQMKDLGIDLTATDQKYSL